MKLLQLLITLVVILITCLSLQADTVILNEKGRALLMQLKSLSSLDRKPDEDDLLKIKSGLDSEYDEVRIEAVKCVLFHRLADLWKGTRPDMKRGTSNQLAFIAYGLFGTARDMSLPLIELLPPFVMNEARKYRQANHVAQRGGDVPLGSVLVDLIVTDTVRYSASRSNFSYAHILKELELTSVQTQLIRSVKKDF